MAQEKLQGGFSGGVEELYREVILDHFKSPKNKGRLPAPNAKADGMNPLCGDQITMTALVDGGVVTDVKFEGHGCAISQSAASMMTDVIKGKTISEIKAIAKTYKKMFGVEDAANLPAAAGESNAALPMDALGDLVALEGVKKYPVRIKCALLSCNTLVQSLDEFQKEQGA